MRVRQTVPPLYGLAKWMQRTGIRGGYRLEQACHQLGTMNVVVSFPLSSRHAISIPLAYRSYDRRMLRDYESATMALLKNQLRRLDGPITLIDCGADIGLMSCKTVASEPRIEKIVAFEPNPTAFPWLERNLTALDIEVKPLNMAVSDFVGQGELRRPAHDPDSEHAAFLVRADGGSIPVTTIDSLELPPGRAILLKIDVEGAELSVVDGASRTLANASGFVIMMEAHRQQVERSGIDTSDIVRRLLEIEGLDVVVAEEPNLVVDWKRPFFSQASRLPVYNVCIVKPSAAA